MIRRCRLTIPQRRLTSSLLVPVKSMNLEKQIDQLRRVIWTLEEDQVTVIQASADLDDQLNSIIETSWVIEWTLDDPRELLEKLEGKKFTVQLDDQSIETVKGIHSEFFAIMISSRSLKVPDLSFRKTICLIIDMLHKTDP